MKKEEIIEIIQKTKSSILLKWDDCELSEKFELGSSGMVLVGYENNLPYRPWRKQVVIDNFNQAPFEAMILIQKITIL